MGRPKSVDKELRIGVSDRIIEMVEEMCNERGITVSELVRACIYETWQRDKDREVERVKEKVKAMTDYRLHKFGK